MYLAYIKTPLPVDLEFMLDIQLMLNTKLTHNITSSTLSLQSKVLYFREPKSSDYPSINVFPS